MRLYYIKIWTRGLTARHLVNYKEMGSSNPLESITNTTRNDTLMITDNRISWDKYWMKITDDISLRSTCIRHNFGCLIVKDNEIIATGYNGAPKYFPHCTEVGCIRDKLKIESGTRHEICRGVHAEQNALLKAGRDSAGATLYVNGYPCKICAKLIINSGIKRVVMKGTYADKEGLKILGEALIETTIYRDDENEDS